MTITASYLHSLTHDSDLSILIEYLTENPTSPVFLHPKCPIWVKNSPDLLRNRDIMISKFPNLSKSSINDYYDPLIRGEKDYNILSLIIKDRNLALYCTSPNKLTIPDTLDQFYKCGPDLFEMYKDQRLQWIESSINDYWGLDVLNDLLVTDKTVTDLVESVKDGDRLNDDELNSYIKIQWLILAASFSLAHYELSFKKIELLKDEAPTKGTNKLIMNCLSLLNGGKSSHYSIQECYDTFNYTQLMKLINVYPKDCIYSYGVKSFSVIIKRKMLISFLNLTKQVSLEMLSTQFATSLDDLSQEISWLIIVLRLPFIIKDGVVIWKPDASNHKVDEISNLIDENIIQGESLRTASLINLSFV